ncbi:hypothetical protein HJ172_23755 [Vibrio parahaemolyticus]|uniref:hypothetical protein n=2 Tax=Vibrio parahaemolyticus TaxID=670 RepID=UPI0004714646|nr:hypothetical protein [Vibrio parahaemolyticus]EGU6979543.1 hypothetical protein [Vibrio parahaemolyticus]EIF8963210.1 hypothetical protein [Vibrio parahaemolyticus]EIO4088600.1 hypothetical protein [Vibrio parahaemolyticus]EME0136121.1 hypothetical protein [Vibrio parahaemolyticus]MBE3849554.1 hypothetical protein [Vibrio parahaemolyticus]
MSVTLATGITLIDFLNKSLETLKLIQKDEPNSTELQLHLASLTQQLSLTMVEASQLQGILAQKNEEIRQLQQKLTQREQIKFDSETEVYWAEGDDSPFCPKCFESSGKYIHLSFYPNSWGKPNPHHGCKVCDTEFWNTQLTNR